LCHQLVKHLIRAFRIAERNQHEHFARNGGLPPGLTRKTDIKG
jgi:hypothetical protein